MQSHESPSASRGLDRAPAQKAGPRSDREWSRPNGHDVGAQLASNAQFKRAMIAQRKGPGGGGPGVLEAAAAGVQGSGSALPYLNVIQRSFGHHAVDGVQAFVGGQAKAASDAIGAEAYATGNSVAFRAAPTLHTAAHEAAHVVQQRAGVQLSGGVGQVGDRYERHADAVADRVVQGKSAVDLLDQFTGGGSAGAAVQKRDAGVDDASDLDAGVGPTGHVDDPCVQELGGSREYRAAGIASIAELEAFQAECVARAEAETKAALEVGTMMTVVGGVTQVLVTISDGIEFVGEAVAKGAKTVAAGGRRVGRTTVAAVTWDEDALLALGDEPLEIFEFAVMLSKSGMRFEQWATEPSGPLTQLLTRWCTDRLDIIKVSAALQTASHAAAGTAVKMIRKKLIKQVIVSPLLKDAVGLVCWAIARAALGGGLAPLASLPTKGTSGGLLSVLVLELGVLGLLEEVSGPRQRLAAKHPRLFGFAEDHRIAFLWTWIEPQLPKLEAALQGVMNEYASSGSEEH